MSGYRGMDELTPRQRRELDAMVDASMRALDGPGGEEVLERMMAGDMSVPDGIVALLIMSGDYERR
jgi:hypothetical protein